MCKNHDEQHYPREIREACMVVALGNAMDRDALMRACVHDGFVALLEAEAECMPTNVLEKALTLVKRHYRLQNPATAELKQRLHERWDGELDRQIEAYESEA